MHAVLLLPDIQYDEDEDEITSDLWQEACWIVIRYNYAAYLLSTDNTSDLHSNMYKPPFVIATSPSKLCSQIQKAQPLTFPRSYS